MKAALADYVRAGGKVLLSGTRWRSDFPELAGVAPEGEPREGYFFLPVGREATIVKGPWQPVTLAGAEALLLRDGAAGTGREYHRRACRHPAYVGHGQVLALHSQFFSFYGSTHYPRSRALVGEWLQALAPDFLVTLDAPARVHLVLRRQGAASSPTW